MTEPHGEEPRGARTLRALALVFLLAVLVGVLAARFQTQSTAKRERQDRGDQLARGPTVSVIKVEPTNTERVTTLPGEVRGYNQVALYPKISGYLTDVRFERGDRVKKGQILAIIESPETDQLVAQADSDLKTKQLNAARARSLATRGAISLFDRDNLSASASIAEAELKRTSALKGYEVIRAPFDGIVTSRYVDPGAFLPAATSSTQTAVPVADLADLDRVRVLVYLGQDIALFAKVGDPVAVWERERPDRRIAASITRCGQALDTRTRTMTCEIVIDNRTTDLRPGSFVEAELHLRVAPVPSIPNEAIMIRSGEPIVAIIDRDRVHLQPIVIGDTDGRTVRVDRGLTGGETIGINVPIEVEEGAIVRAIVVPPAPTGPAIGGGPSSSAPPQGSGSPSARPPGPSDGHDAGR
jgi:RND family efflux transporter MFP subunit